MQWAHESHFFERYSDYYFSIRLIESTDIKFHFNHCHLYINYFAAEINISIDKNSEIKTNEIFMNR